MGKKRHGKGSTKGKSKGRHGQIDNPSVPNKKAESCSNELEFRQSSVKSGSRCNDLPGLANLGNTCFFNAVMQSLGQSHYFKLRLGHLITSPSFKEELHLPDSEAVLTLDVSTKLGDLTTKLGSFLTAMQEGGGACLNPKPVFSEICKKASRFSSYAQQDSQELLRYLLDSLRSEEIHRLKHAILRAFGIGNTKTGHLTEKQKSSIKAYGMQTMKTQTFVDDVFGGLLISTVTCDTCSNHTTMQESFLDLSLPVSEDKASTASTVSGGSGGYQNQVRKKRNKASGSEDWEEPNGQGYVEDNTGYSSRSAKKLTKHQVKKMEREARKATKRAKRKDSTKSLQEFLQNDPIEAIFSSKTAPPPLTHPKAEHKGEPPEAVEPHDVEPVLQEGIPPMDPAMSVPAAEGATPGASCGEANISNELLSEQSPELDKETESGVCGPPVGSVVSKYTPALGEPAAEGATPDASLSEASISNELLSEQSSVLELDKGTKSGACGPPAGSVTSEYASSSPQPDVAHSKLDGEEMLHLATLALADSQAEVTQNEEGIGEDITGEDITAGAGVSMEAEVEGAESMMGAKQMNFEADSLHKLLERFCAKEYLTRDNKFACTHCTKLLAGEEERRYVHGTDGGKERDKLSQSCGDKGVDDAVACVGEGGGVWGSVGSDSSGVERSSDEGETCEDRGSTRRQSSVESEDPTDKVKPAASRTAFCDASKQLLIHTPPSVLTLHLKRFSQQGRRLSKNSRHISFPFLLDLSPFCIDNCKATYDSAGRLLYSLYGVVVHSGGMQGGHYVAYIKQQSTTTKATPGSTAAQSVRKVGDKLYSVNSHSPSTSTDPARTDLTTTSTTDPITSSTTTDLTTTSSTTTDLTTSSTTTDLTTSSTTTDLTNPTTFSTSTVMGRNGVEDATEANLSHDNHQRVEVNDLRSNGPTEFDLTPIAGQWYYASDSHVRKAVQEEVKKSQAYLLFYEQLPLLS